jgi:hypothetical protein
MLHGREPLLPALDGGAIRTDPLFAIEAAHAERAAAHRATKMRGRPAPLALTH